MSPLQKHVTTRALTQRASAKTLGALGAGEEVELARRRHKERFSRSHNAEDTAAEEDREGFKEDRGRLEHVCEILQRKDGRLR